MALGEFVLKKSQAYVVDPASQTGIDARDTVNARYADLAGPTGFIATAKAELNDAIEALQNAVGTIPVDALAASGLVVPDFAVTVPDFTETFDAEFTAVAPTFTPIFSAPTGKPDTSGIGWQDEVISLEADLVTAVAAWLDGTESAIPPALQQQIFDAAILRVDEKKVDSLAEFDSVMAARAYSCPPGALSIHRARIEGEFAKAAGEVSAKIAEKDMDLIQANKHKAGELAQAYVAAGKQYLVEKNKFILAALETSVNLWIKEYDAAIKYLEAQVEAFKAQMEGYKAEADVYKVQGDVFETQAKAFVAVIEGVKAKSQLMVDNVRLKIERYKADAETDAKEAELKVNAKIAEHSLAEKMADSMAGYYAQMTASGMAGIHISAGISASRSDSLGVDWNWSYSEQVSEHESEQVSYSSNVNIGTT